MRIAVVQAPDAHGTDQPLRTYVGHVIPLRVTHDPALAVAARIEAVQPAEDGQVLVTFDLLGAELLWNVLTNEHHGPAQTGAL